MPRQPPPGLLGTIADAARAAGLPLSVALAVAYVESRFVHTAESPAGAQGLYQLMPVTQRTYGVSDPFDPEQSARAGTLMLARLHKRFGDWPTALAAYNWGPGNVRRALEAGREFPSQVQSYARKVLNASEDLFGHAQELEPAPPVPFPPPPPGAPTGPGWAWVWACCGSCAGVDHE